MTRKRGYVRHPLARVLGSLAVTVLFVDSYLLLVTPGEGGSLGDASCDGQVGSIDAALVLQRAAGLVQALPCGHAADVNIDEAINALDAALILQFTAGLVPDKLNCPAIPYHGFTVVPPDPHGFDGDGDGIGCES